ncbi:TetR family transcriptional regulator [Streptacidiphilus sp. ASG 303]|uniref:TetR/AcrR family transcriptional regulator n=1 Tax=Streptacidiphilus sp. ASG 303 TaxID=2896847 RepID=UPI001E471C52|nr:TetR/AcrR family transcriptional regulator [Streptacidiphilus sp. ASG 303]MCD0484097.1 TetR family transcriptional regulator [Streptacidiphilus sp. ASG 303]
MTSPAPQVAHKRKRTRDPEGKRAAIIAAARAVFAERGFARATIREIAQRAGVTHGLVVMHFTTKERLFVAAVPGPRDLADSVAGDLEGLPGRVARAYVARMESADQADPFIALVRAAADQEAAKALLHAMRTESVVAYQELLTGPDVDVRVDMVGSFLVGVTLSRYVLADGPLAALTPEEFTGLLTDGLRGILFGAP